MGCDSSLPWARVGGDARVGAVCALPPAEERDAVRTELLPSDAVEEEVDGTARKQGHLRR